MRKKCPVSYRIVSKMGDTSVYRIVSKMGDFHEYHIVLYRWHFWLYRSALVLRASQPGIRANQPGLGPVSQALDMSSQVTGPASPDQPSIAQWNFLAGKMGEISLFGLFCNKKTNKKHEKAIFWAFFHIGNSTIHLI